MNGKSNATTVQGTNDSSILSKHSMTKGGYAADDFLGAFTLKSAPRRAPLINRGYYIRSKSIDLIMHSFMMEQGSKQIVSLGAGFDTTFFRLSALPSMSQHMQGVYYVEVDFPEVAERKEILINGSEHCKSYLKQTLNIGHDAVKISTPNYCLIGVDLADMTTLKQIWLTHTKLKTDRPTLVLSECVMTYMEHQISTKLVKFALQTFPASLFVTYEQVQPYDAFGEFMRSHFDKLNSSLKGITTYTTKQRQIDRYHSSGYKKVNAFTMKEFYDSLPLDEKERVDQLEYFDEFEEWHLKCYHYVLVLARNDGSFTEVESIIQSLASYEEEPGEGNKKSLATTCVIPGAEQFSHASCLIRFDAMRTVLFTHGGFGVTEGRHCRQGRIRAYAVEELDVSCKEFECADAVPCRLHHTMTSLSNSRIFMFGGRLSPGNPIDNPIMLQATYDSDQAKVDVSSVADNGDKPEARWRHAAVYISIDDADYVLITGGLSTTKASQSSFALSSCRLFNASTSTWRHVPDYSQPLHSHSMCYDGSRYVYSVGGLGAGDLALSDCYRLDIEAVSGGWCRISLPIQHVYSHNVHMVNNRMMIVGGIGLNGQQLNIQHVNLCSMSYRQLFLPVSIGNSLRMYFNHTSHIFGDDDRAPTLIVVGGGGNCFSFGTHINGQILFHTLEYETECLEL